MAPAEDLSGTPFEVEDCVLPPTGCSRGNMDLVQEFVTIVECRPSFAEDQFNEVKRILDEGSAAEKADLWTGQQQFTFLYKKRRCTGSALHIAALRKDGPPVVEELLGLKADVNCDCRYTSFNKEGTAQAIHLAVQSGNPEMLAVLLEGGADINARAKRDGIPHFSPLHEASFFRDPLMAAVLLDLKADVNAQNLENMTPLHVAAKMGSADVAEVLVRYFAETDLVEAGNKTALKVAVESGVFPQNRLHLLAKWSIADILTVAQYCPSAAAEFIRDLLRTDGLSSTHEAQSKRNTARYEHEEDAILEVGQWVELMDLAPDAAVLLFEALTVEPQEDSVFYHPLPTQAMITELRCEYTTDMTWKCETESSQGQRQWPAWHDRLAPGGMSRKHRAKDFTSSAPILLGQSRDFQPVKIRQLRMHGVICEQVLQVLAETQYLDVFRNQAVQSVLTFTWTSFACRYYTGRIISKVVELALLTWWTIRSPGEEGFDHWRCRATWSLLLVFALREVAAEVFKIHGILVFRTSGIHGPMFWSWSNLVSILNTLLFMVFVILAALSRNFDLDEDCTLFSCVVLSRWLLFLWALTPIDIGSIGVQGLIPILSSIKQLFGMMLICAFTFFGFLHAFMVLDDGHSDSGPWGMVILACQLLLMKDGAHGVDNLLSLGGRDASGDFATLFFLIVAVLVFCISLLNLFIAVYGAAYHEAFLNASSLFLQERAVTCLNCMMQPHWPFFQRSCGILSHRVADGWMSPVVYSAIISVAVGLWCGLLLIDGLHPAVPAVLILLPAVLVGDCILLQRPWESEQVRATSLLWWCGPNRQQGGRNAEEERQVAIDAIVDRMVRAEALLEDILMSGASGPSFIQDSHVPEMRRSATTNDGGANIGRPRPRRLHTCNL